MNETKAEGSDQVWISIVIPVFNEEACLPEVYNSVKRAAAALPRPAEVIFVDDGSSDRSPELLAKIVESDPAARVIRLRRNFGQTAALSAGFDHARGEIIISMDGDGQNDPADIPRLVAKLDEGYDVVNGWRRRRKDSFLTRRAPSWLGNVMIRTLTGVQLHDFGCTLKAYRREVIKEISLYGEMHRMIPVLAQLMGAVIGEVEVRHHARSGGRSKYTIFRAFNVLLDLITLKFFLGYFTRPLHIFGLVGLFSMGLGGLAFIALVLMKIYQQVDMTGNPFLVVGTLLIIVGTQLVMFGLLGEVNIRTYFESQSKPIYIVKEIKEHRR